MSDDSPELLIKTVIDPSGADAGASQTVTDLSNVKAAADDVTESTGKAAKGFDKMVEEAGTMREAQRLSMGLFDTFEGGGRTIQGAAEMMRFFLLTAVDVNPVLLAASVIGAGLVAAMARGEEASGKTKDAMKGDADDIATKVEEIFAHLQDQAQKLDLKNITDQLHDILETQKQIKAIQDAQDAASVARIKDDLSRIEPQRGLALAQLDANKEIALAGTDDPIKKAQIEEDAAKKKQAIEQQYIRDKTDFQLAQNQRERDANLQQQHELIENAKDAQAAIDAARKKAADSAATAADEGVVPGADGSYGDAIKAQVESLKPAAEANNAAQKKLQDISNELAERRAIPTAIGGVGNAMVIDKLIHEQNEAQLQADAAYQAFHGARNKFIDIQTAETDRQAAEKTEKQYQATLDNSVALYELTSKLKTLESDVTNIVTKAQTDRSLVDTKAGTDISRENKEAADQKAKDDYAVREAQRYAAKKPLTDVQDDPNATPDQKAAAKAKAAGIDAAGYQDQLDNAALLQLSQATIIKLRADLDSAKRHGVDVVGAQQKKDDTKSLDDQIRDARAQIEAMPKNAQRNADLKFILETVMDKTTELADLHALTLTTFSGKFGEMKQASEDVKDRLKRLEGQ